MSYEHRGVNVVVFIASIIFLLFIAPMHTDAQQPVISFEPAISTGLQQPTDVVNAGDGTHRIFVVGRFGNIRVYDSALNFLNTFVTIDNSSVGGWRGLMSMAFHPNYENNRYFFVFYSNNSDEIELARYRTSNDDPNTADPTSKVVILNIPKPAASSNPHIGCKLNFGPDGYLYFALGDGSDEDDDLDNAQNPTTLFGKMIRIDVNNFTTSPYYSIPPDNPYAASIDTLPSIWAFGLRNPWRWSFDKLTGDMWIGDVGQMDWEEVNFTPAGSAGGMNYGWRCYEGNHVFNLSNCNPALDTISPAFEYDHSAAGGVSVNGGFVYRGAEYPNLYGQYICNDLSSGNLWLVAPDGSGGWRSERQISNVSGQLVGFGESEVGTLYMVSLIPAIVYKTVDLATVPVKLISFRGKATVQGITLEWQTETEDNVLEYIVEYNINGAQFSPAGKRNATNSRIYLFDHIISAAQPIQYRLKILDHDGRFEYSPVIVVNSGVRENTKFIFPAVINNSILSIHSNDHIHAVKIINMGGSLVYQRRMKLVTGRADLSLPTLAPGVYKVILSGKRGLHSQTIYIR